MSTADAISDQRYAKHRSTLTGLGMVLDAAEAAGLPAPYIVSSSAMMLHVSSRDELTAWTEWLDVAELVQHDHENTVQHWATGEKFDVPVTAMWIEDVAPRIPQQRKASA